MTTSDHKILLLGHKGMLGHMVKKYLDQFYEIEVLNHRWPSKEYKNAIKQTDSNILINCIGAIPQRTEDFKINFELPMWLDDNFNGNIIHPGTDCESDDDDYGSSKRTAADWIIESGKKTKMLKTSIIGPELNSSSSFLFWFLSNEDDSSVNGYVNHMWNGITTYYWAKFSKNLIESWDDYSKRTVLGSDCVSKYDMCNIFNKAYDRKIIVNKFETSAKNDKCLSLDVKLDSIDVQLSEMIKFLKVTTR
tara:strand:- start:323 stop:1069 length:747 start_codon:yes stop_codon:yes gene_type:complete